MWLVCSKRLGSHLFCRLASAIAALVAGPPSPLKPAVPVPAMVVTMPVCAASAGNKSKADKRRGRGIKYKFTVS